MDLRDSRQTKRPTHIPDYADFCLRAIAQQELGNKISLGGAFGLLHYLDYRSTFDVDVYHLARIERQRPTEQIAELEQRTQAEQVRQWYKAEFLHAIMD
jgi:hypothetical protein